MKNYESYYRLNILKLLLFAIRIIKLDLWRYQQYKKKLKRGSVFIYTAVSVDIVFAEKLYCLLSKKAIHLIFRNYSEH